MTPSEVFQVLGWTSRDQFTYDFLVVVVATTFPEKIMQRENPSTRFLWNAFPVAQTSGVANV